ncbi:MAG: FAD-binding protein, partial [Pseudomonadota bacterium]
YSRLSQGFTDIEIPYRLHISRIKEIVDKLESYGIEMRDPETGDYIRTKSFGQPGPYYINFKGKDLKPILAGEVRKSGAKTLNRVNVTNLITDGKKVLGAMGFNVRNGKFYVIRSKTAIITTGDATRLWPNDTGLPFNTWMSPFNNGAGHAMAFRAGAHLANMELTVSTITPKGFSAAGLNAFIGMGSYLWNSVGERYMIKYHPMAEGAPRYILALATFREMTEGRGPCYVDCRHLPKKAMEHLKTNLLPVDKDTFMIFVEQKGLKLERDMLELQISEIQVGGITGSLSGIVIDKRGKTTVPRLYAAGACTVPSYALSGALATGYSVGMEAGKACLRISEVDGLDDSLIQREIQETYAPLRRKKGSHYKIFENRLRQIMSDYVGHLKTEKGIKTGLEKLKDLESRMEEIKGENLHELMRISEFKDLLLIGKLVSIGALNRKESRMGLSHIRGDFPDQDDRHFHGSILLKRAKNGEIRATFKPAKTGKL